MGRNRFGISSSPAKMQILNHKYFVKQKCKVTRCGWNLQINHYMLDLALPEMLKYSSKIWKSEKRATLNFLFTKNITPNMPYNDLYRLLNPGFHGSQTTLGFRLSISDACQVFFFIKMSQNIQ